MVEDYVLSDSRIVSNDENKDIKDYILCGICYQVVTENRGPVECNSCHNQLFCTQCIQGWANSNSTCPYCHAANAKYVEISPLLLNMIKEIKYHCKYKESEGCTFTDTAQGLPKHEYECVFGLNRQSMRPPKVINCQFCHKLASKQPPSLQFHEHGQYQPLGDDDEDHVCDFIMNFWCFDHKQLGLKYQNSRIANIEETQRYFDLFNLLLMKISLVTCQVYQINSRFTAKIESKAAQKYWLMKMQRNMKAPVQIRIKKHYLVQMDKITTSRHSWITYMFDHLEGTAEILDMIQNKTYQTVQQAQLYP
eukprot:403353232